MSGTSGNSCNKLIFWVRAFLKPIKGNEELIVGDVSYVRDVHASLVTFCCGIVNEEGVVTEIRADA